MEVDDVLADKVIQLGRGVLAPEGIEIQLGGTGAEVLEAGHIADRCIQPDVEVLARLVGDLEAEVGRIAADIPFLQTGIQPFGDLVGHRILQGAAAGPLLEHGLEVRQLEEEVLGVAQFRHSAGNRRAWVLQLGGLVGGAAFLAVVAVLVLGRTLGAGALDKAVGEEHALLGVEVLGYRAGGDMALVTQGQIDGGGQLAVLNRVSRMVVIEIHQKIGKVGGMLGLHIGDQLLGGDAFLLGAQHDGRAMGVVGADVDGLVAAQFLEAHPHIGLDIFEHMTQVDRTVGIGQGAGNENLAGLAHGNRLHW